MAKFPGSGDRIVERFHALGFWKNEHPDVGRFCEEKGYRPQYVYAWLKDRVPAYDNLKRLADDLNVAPRWLLFGEDVREGAGEWVSVGTRASPEPAHRGSSVPTATIIDVRRLREATETVVALQSELEAIVKAFPDLLVWLAPDGTILDCNAGPAAQIGLRMGSELIGRQIKNALVAASTAGPGEIGTGASAIAGGSMAAGAGRALARALAGAVKGGALAVTQFSLLVENERRTYEGRLMPVQEQGRRPGKVLLIIRDITERKRMDDALLESETRYRTVVEDSGKGMAIHVDFSIQFANRALAAMFGYRNTRDLIGKDIRTLIPDHLGWAADDEDARRSGGLAVPARRTYEGVRSDGTRFPLVALVSGISWGGRPASFLTLQKERGESS